MSDNVIGGRDLTSPAALKIAVVGRPNVGKSSFVNRLLGEERLVVSDVAGTTRDASDSPMRYHERDIVLIDTAGLARPARGSVGGGAHCAPPQQP